MATTMPIRLTDKIHTDKRDQGNCLSVKMAKAGMGATNPEEIMEAAEDAVVWLILFSRSPQGSVWAVVSRAFQKAKLIKAAVMDILNAQPIFSPL
jgi:hypothetical protein